MLSNLESMNVISATSQPETELQEVDSLNGNINEFNSESLQGNGSNGNANLNDNEMSIAPPVGAMSSYLSRLSSSRAYQGLRDIAKGIAEIFPRPLQTAAKRAEGFARTYATGGTMFEELGFYYIGPIDGHNIDHLLPVEFRQIRRN